ncbi:MAG: DUF559 domain-containing protein [Herbiconiux sp.]|nr:DUF559 domain-containing protein [Herbiconiux sp.]
MSPPRSSLPEVARTGTLKRLGVTGDQLLELLASGLLVRIRRGYYARPDARPDVVRAVRLGGRLTSYSALRALGVWCPPGDERLHVAVSAHAHELRDPDSGLALGRRDDLVLHWRCAPLARGRSISGVVPAAIAVQHLPAELSEAELVAVLDSAVRQHVASRAHFAAAFEGDRRLTAALRRVDTSAESGTESVARIRMQDVGIDARTQVWFGRHRVDFLIEERLVVEVDGKAFHDDEKRFERDRRKAADLTRRGLHVLHFSYSQVFYDWPMCLAAIRAALIRPF